MEHLSPTRLRLLRDRLLEAQANAPRLSRVSAASGRGFVIGDVHGAFDEVWNAMQAAGFDRSRDMLYSVGDLVDRGQDSHRATAFLRQPYVRAIIGNHEAALIEIYRDQDDPDICVEAISAIDWNGMGWLGRVSAEDRAQAVEQFALLPMVIEVETARGTVGLVHGEVPRGMHWLTFLDKIQAGDPATMAACLEGRERVERRDRSGVEGVGRIYSGHTIRWEGAERFGNVWAIDTGAIFASHKRNPRGRLTIADMVCNTACLAAPREVGNVHVLDEPAACVPTRSGFPIRRESSAPSPIPFGAYIALESAETTERAETAETAELTEASFHNEESPRS